MNPMTDEDMAAARQAAGLVDVKEGMRVLCLGRYAAVIAAQLTQRGAEVVAVWRPETLSGVFQPLPLTAGAVTAVVASGCLHRPTCPGDVLEECRRVLAAYGRMVLVETDLPKTLQNSLQRWMDGALSNVIVGRAECSGAWMATGVVSGPGGKRGLSERIRRRVWGSGAGSPVRSHAGRRPVAVPGG